MENKMETILMGYLGFRGLEYYVSRLEYWGGSTANAFSTFGTFQP